MVGPVELIPVSKGKNAWLSKEDWKRSWKPWLTLGIPTTAMALIFVASWWLRRRQASLEAVAEKDEVSV